MTGILDYITRVDDLLVDVKRQSAIHGAEMNDTFQAIKALQEESKVSMEAIRDIQQGRSDLETKNLQITYPSEGGTKTVPPGVTTFNFVTGVVTLPTGVHEDMSESLHDNNDTHCRSLLLKANKPITIRIDEEGAFSPDAQAYFQVPYKQFRSLRITTTSLSTKISVQAFTNPAASAYMSSVASIYSIGETREWLEIDGDTYFTDALVQDASEDENLTIDRDEITLLNVSLYSIQQLKYRLWFYSRDTFAVDDILGYVDFDLPATNITKVIGATTYYYYNITDVDIPYRDANETSELHMQVENKSVAAKIAGAGGKVQISVCYGINS